MGGHHSVPAASWGDSCPHPLPQPVSHGGCTKEGGLQEWGTPGKGCSEEGVTPGRRCTVEGVPWGGGAPGMELQEREVSGMGCPGEGDALRKGCSGEGVPQEGRALGKGVLQVGLLRFVRGCRRRGCSRRRVRLSRAPASRSRIDPAANLHSQIFGFAARGRLSSSRPGGRGPAVTVAAAPRSMAGRAGSWGGLRVRGRGCGGLRPWCSTHHPPSAPTGFASPCGARSGGSTCATSAGAEPGCPPGSLHGR